MKIFFLGDTHGFTAPMQKLAKKAKNLGADCIVQLGDFGFTWASDNRVEQANNVLKQFDMPLYFIDGNHDDFWHLDYLGASKNSTEMKELAEYVTYIPRGFTWEWDGIRFLGLGGAVSIDQASRVMGVSWWPEERITKAEIEEAAEKGKVDILLTHDAPYIPNSFIENSLAGMNFKADSDSKVNRMAISYVADRVDPSLILHGHMHYRYNAIWNHRTVVGLGESRQGNNCWVFINTDHLKDHINEYRNNAR